MIDSGATPAPPAFARSAAVAAEVGPGPLRHVAETGSTNDDLAREARAGDTDPCILVADHQTAGRGRLDHTWDDDPGGAVLVSLRVHATADLARWVVGAVAAAARAAIGGLVDEPVKVKWPNDLVAVGGPAPGKLAGVLAELVTGAVPVVVVGIGINIAPLPRQVGATSLVELESRADRDVVLAELLTELAPRLADPSQVLDELRRHSATLGTDVRAELPGGQMVEGRAVGLDADGHLVVEEANGATTTVSTADVVHLRSR